MHDLKQAKLKLGNQYIIPFTGLKEGEHLFKFNFGKEFFDQHDVLEAQGGNLEASVLLIRKPTMLILEVAIEGSFEIKCDRCLDYFPFPLRFRGNLIVKFGSDTSAGTDEIWILPPGEHDLKLEQYFFECISLCLPIKRTHPDDSEGRPGCNSEMLNLLGNHSYDDVSSSESDPRWNELKNILNNTNNN